MQSRRSADFPGSAPAFDEHRIWQQALWAGPIERVRFQSRSRLEQRFVETGSDVGWRFRQFFKGSYPFAFERRLALVGYEEAFFDLNDTNFGQRAGFSQNRLFLGLGWSIDEARHWTIELGYLNQLILRNALNDSMNHILNLNLLLSY